MRWYLTYLAGWIVGAGVVSVLVASLVGELLRGSSPVDSWLLGAAFGSGLGLLLARGSADRPAVHRWLRRAGACMCLALPLAALMWWWAEVERTRGTYLGGLGEIVVAYVCLILGVAGAGFLLAGISGRMLRPT
jgi:hypothetical protein